MTKFVSSHQEKAVATVMTESVFFVSIKVVRGGAPGPEIASTNHGALTVRVSVKSERENARSAVAVPAVSSVSCKKVLIYGQNFYHTS